ncbi:hypothetical protein [Mycobacterium haemophilum]|nr:hypothetical protein [Mycobacterium haemophilum]
MTIAAPLTAGSLTGADVEELDIQARTTDCLAHFPQPAAQSSV